MLCAEKANKIIDLTVDDGDVKEEPSISIRRCTFRMKDQVSLSNIDV
jgi:hypothetical protein